LLLAEAQIAEIRPSARPGSVSRNHPNQPVDGPACAVLAWESAASWRICTVTNIAAADRLLSVREAASYLNVGMSTLRQSLYAGTGPRSYKLPGSNRWRFRLRDLNEWLESGATPKAEAKEAV
jgi:excisionase family DNA binding protein